MAILIMISVSLLGCADLIYVNEAQDDVKRVIKSISIELEKGSNEIWQERNGYLYNVDEIH